MYSALARLARSKGSMDGDTPEVSAEFYTSRPDKRTAGTPQGSKWQNDAILQDRDHLISAEGGCQFHRCLIVSRQQLQATSAGQEKLKDLISLRSECSG